MSSAPETTCVCEIRGETYVQADRSPLAVRMFCSDACKRAGHLARKRAEAARRARGGVVRRPKLKPAAYSQVPDLPRPPDLSRGRCATAPPHLRHLWTSDVPSERRAARQICLACPVLEACREYALALPGGYYGDSGIYGGMTQNARRTAREARRAAALASAS